MAWDRVYQSLPAVAGGLSTLLRGSNHSKDLSLIGNKDLIKIGNALNSLPLDSKIDFPRIVVVGAQSSGKTSILNGILAMDLLPTGTDMVTRTPLHLQLVQLPDSTTAYCQFKHLPEKKFPLSMPRPTGDEVSDVRTEITKITNTLAGPGMDVASVPIHLKVYSPNVPNLSLYDLPGLTLVACTDKGQPADIKDKIRRMVGEHIKESRSLILAVMPARADLQVDMALDLIKEYDPTLDRTIGVLTKPDLVDCSTNMAPYLRRTVSRDLQTKYGYYVVRNRTATETVTMDVIQGAQKEQEFFATHKMYRSAEFSKRLGVGALGQALAQVLVGHLRNTLPEVVQELLEKEIILRDELTKLGTPVPTDPTQKALYLQRILVDYAKQFSEGISRRSAAPNVGRAIKNIFLQYNEDLIQLDPFSEDAYPDEKLNDILANCEGLRMSSTASHIEVLEACLKDSVGRPLHQCLSPSIVCLTRVDTVLNDHIDSLIMTPDILQFPLLGPKIREVTRREILGKAMEDARCLVNELVDMESCLIWTLDRNFKELLSKSCHMRALLQGYFNTVVDSLSSSVPKVVVKIILNHCQNTVLLTLLEHLGKSDSLLQEDAEMEAKKASMHKDLNNIIDVRKMLDDLLSGN